MKSKYTVGQYVHFKQGNEMCGQIQKIEGNNLHIFVSDPEGSPWDDDGQVYVGLANRVWVE